MEERCRFRPPEEGRQLTWEVTRYCNLLCDHCCTSSGPSASRIDEPPLETMIAVARSLVAADVSKVQFSGGEPFLRRGFLDIIEAVDATRVQIHIASNGYWLPDRSIRRMVDAGVHKLSVSVDGGDADEHDLLRRRIGAFTKTLSGIERAVSAGIRVGVSVTVTPRNVRSLDALLNRLCGIGVYDVSLHSVLPVGRASEHPELQFGVSDGVVFRDEVLWLQQAFSQRIVFDHSFDSAGSRSGTGCPAQARLLHIDPAGDVSPCSWLYKLDPRAFTLGNITDDAFVEIVSRGCNELERARELGDQCILPFVSRRVSR